MQRHRTTTGPAVILGVLLLPWVALALFGSDSDLISFFPDDAFYYLKTAHNLFQLGFPSFDGINPTNGFHPLYFLLVSGVAALVPHGWLLNAVFLAHIALLWLAMLIVLDHTEGGARWLVVLLAGVLAFPATFLFVWLSAGMEAPLVVLFTVVLIECWRRAHRLGFRGSPANLALGAAIPGYMLSRLDLVLTLVPFAGWAAIQVLGSAGGAWRQALCRMAELFVIPLVAGSLYLAFNLWSTGHLIPVSAAVKREFVIPFEISWKFSTGDGSPHLLVVALGPLLLALVAPFAAWRRADRSTWTVVVIASAAVLIYYGYLYWVASNFFRWYFAMPLAVSAWTLVQLLSLYLAPMSGRWVVQHPRAVTSVVGAIFVTVLAANSLLILRYSASETKVISWHLMRIGEQLAQVSSEDSIAATYDAGAIGYFSNRPVINLDGLANSYSYLENHRSTGRLAEYLDRQGVTYFLLRLGMAGNRREIASGKYQKVVFLPDRRVELLSKNELFRYEIPGGFTVIAFRYEPTR